MRKLLKGKMKKVVATGLCLAMVAGCLAGCGSSDDKSSESSTAAEKTEDVGEKTEAPSGEKKGTINVWAFTDEVPKMIDKYVETHPDFGYEINTTIVATTDGAYQPALDQALAAGGPDAPDIYCAEAAFVLKYTQVMHHHMQQLMRILELMLTARLLRLRLLSTQLISVQIQMVR